MKKTAAYIRDNIGEACGRRTQQSQRLPRLQQFGQLRQPRQSQQFWQSRRLCGRLAGAALFRVFAPALLALALALAVPGGDTFAASGTVYTCKINPCYAHPVTGEIEDAGGSSSTTTGQGMVEGALGDSGILEVTDDGKYYLTFRMGLIDYTSDHEFGVQTVGDSEFESVSAETTATGSDTDGANADMRVEVPSESCIVRCSMYVDPMGRSVIFYFYPSDYTSGNTTDMKAAIVTEASTGNAASATSASDDTASGSDDSAASSDTSDTGADTASSADSADDTLSSTEGLSLSTADESATEEETSDGGSTNALTMFLAVLAGVTVAGLILLFVGAYLVYFCRKNWKRWGAGDDTDDDAGNFDAAGTFMGEGFGAPDLTEDPEDTPGIAYEDPEDLPEIAYEDPEDLPGIAYEDPEDLPEFADEALAGREEERHEGE